MKAPVPYKQTINGTFYWVARLGRGLAGGKERKHYFSPAAWLTTGPSAGLGTFNHARRLAGKGPWLSP